MTDQPETPRLSAEDEARVRRELADAAAGPEAIPADVAGRLDDVLAGLVRERAGESAVDAAPPRRPQPSRRRWPALLVAAAALVAVLLGVGTLLTSVTGPQSAEQGSGAASAPKNAGPSSAPESAGALGTFSRAAPVARLHSGTFHRDVARLTEGLSASAPRDHLQADGTLRGAPRTKCLLPPVPPGGKLLRVTLDGRPASLVLWPPRDGTRVVRAYSCADTETPVRSTVVRAR